VKTIVDDPQYLAQPFITSTHFKKQGDASGWNPMPCSGRWAGVGCSGVLPQL